MNRRKKRIAWLCAAVILAAGLIGWVIWANTALELNTVVIREEELPESFDGFRIAHVSDLHSADMTQELAQMLRQAQPDIICITGDLSDSRDTNVDIALEFAREAAQIAPCYYITGNHEARHSAALYNELLEGLASAGVTVLNDQEVILSRDGKEIAVVGHFWGDTDDIGEISDFEGYRILLSHQPEDFDNYVAAGYDLVLSGHAHGGQFRLPFIGGVYAPGQGFFPKYDAGVYSAGVTDMVVSRGIGNSTIPLRLNNRPEVVLVVLECLTASD